MSLMELIARHGYAVTGLVLLVASLGIPLPMTITLLAAGAAGRQGLRMEWLLPVAWGSAMAGDTLLYLGGRYTGWWLLTGMCRLSMNPERCIMGSAQYFYQKGSRTLLFAKFVPGLGAMAAPVAGSLNMRFWRFARMAALGNLIFCGLWLGVGYGFSGLLLDIVRVLTSAGQYLMGVVAVLLVGYGLAVLWFLLRTMRYRGIERISAAGLLERISGISVDSGFEKGARREPVVVIADVRSHGYYDPGMQRIKNSIRVEPHRLKEEIEALREFMAPECELYVYCSCIRDTTSVRVAHMLQQENCRIQVIEGGLKAWVRAGGELEMVPESDLQRLPRFDS